MLSRRQAHSLFLFRVNVKLNGCLIREGNEVDVTALQHEAQHFDIYVAMLKSDPTRAVETHLRFRGISTTTYRLLVRFHVNQAVPLRADLDGEKVRLQLEAVNTNQYAFFAAVGEGKDDGGVTVYG